MGRSRKMPKQYEKIRDSYKRRGMSDKKAKELAARTYNKRRKKGQKPVTGKHKEKK